MNDTKNTLDIVVKAIEKKFGIGAITTITKEAIPDPGNVYSSGCISLDTALGVGGYPKGRIIELFGPDASGKTTTCLEAVARAQADGNTCAFIDAEHSLDVLYASNIGVDLDTLLISQPDSGEQALEIVNILARSGVVGLVVVDSVAALVPKAELDGEIGDSLPGIQARLMSKGMRMLAGVLDNAQCTVIFTNQQRSKIGVQFGSPITTSGGNALKYYASQRLKIRRTGDIKQDDKVLGHATKIDVVKNKVAPPKRSAEFDIIFGKGIDKDKDILNCAIEECLITKAGSWYKYNDANIAQGQVNAAEWLQDNPEIREQLRDNILSGRGLK